jgi:hypothetical protein
MGPVCADQVFDLGRRDGDRRDLLLARVLVDPGHHDSVGPDGQLGGRQPIELADPLGTLPGDAVIGPDEEVRDTPVRLDPLESDEMVADGRERVA